MKILRSLLAILVIGAVMVSLGCSKKKDNPTAPATTTTLPAATQVSLATSATGYGTTCQSNINSVGGFLSGNAWKGSKDTIPPYWWGPINNWYYLYYGASGNIPTTGDTTAYVWRWSLRMYPDVWGTPAYDEPDSVEWRWDYRDTTVSYWYYAKCGFEVGDTTMIKGLWQMHMDVTGTSYSFTWTYTFDHVSILPGNYSGHYTFSCPNWYYFNGQTIATANLTGDFTYIADGSGTGSISVAGVETVRYVFNAGGGGYYTLLAENWGTQHPFYGKK